MAETPRETTRRNWWILIILTVVVAAAVVWWLATRPSADIGGTIAMGSAQPPAERPMEAPTP